METEITDFETNDSQDKMPTFLKVLCILTFVGSGFGILSGIASFTFLTPDVAFENLAKSAADLGSKLPDYDEFVKWTNYSNIIGFIMSMLGLLAGILMWKRMKIGYYIYIFSWVGAIAMMIAASKHVYDSMTEKVFPIVLVLTILIMAAFVIMYGINLKHMKK